MGARTEDGSNFLDNARNAVREFELGDLETAALMALVDARESFILTPSDETCEQIILATEALDIFCDSNFEVMKAHNRINREVFTALDFAENGDQ